MIFQASMTMFHVNLPGCMVKLQPYLPAIDPNFRRDILVMDISNTIAGEGFQ